MTEQPTGNRTPLFWGGDGYHKKRYHTWNHHLRQTFHEKIFKVPLDAGFTCPNRDGSKGTGGCTFCSAEGSGDFAGDRRDSLETQFRSIRDKMHQKWPNAKYLGYFQAFTNTYAPAHELREMYETILQQEGVVGLSIATRPDCLPDDVVELLAELNEKTYLWVELGLQTVHEHTAQLINRGHDYQTYIDGVEKLRKHNIRVCSHMILGLPGETEQDMMETARAIADLPVQGIKIHLLHLLKYTPLVKLWEQGGLRFLEKDQYIRLVVDILEILPPDMVIHRLTGDGPPDILIGPMWSLDKWGVLNGIDAELERRNTWQGRLWTPNEPWKPGEPLPNPQADFVELPVFKWTVL